MMFQSAGIGGRPWGGGVHHAEVCIDVGSIPDVYLSAKKAEPKTKKEEDTKEESVKGRRSTRGKTETENPESMRVFWF